jgi:hypothetical protein
MNFKRFVAIVVGTVVGRVVTELVVKELRERGVLDKPADV